MNSTLNQDGFIDQTIELNIINSAEPKQRNRIEEIELVHRLDKRLLVFAMFGNLVKTLDNTNLGINLLTHIEQHDFCNLHIIFRECFY